MYQKSSYLSSHDVRLCIFLSLQAVCITVLCCYLTLYNPNWCSNTASETASQASKPGILARGQMEDEAEVQRSLEHQWKSRRDPVKGAHGISTQVGEQTIGEPTPGRQLEELEGQTTQPDADGSTRIAGQLLTWDPSPQPQGPATPTPIPTHPVPSVEEQGGKRKYETLNYPLTSEETVQMRSPKSGLCAASLLYGDLW